jgi:hypothetical protein
MRSFSSIRRTGLIATLITSSLLGIPFLGNRLAQAQIGVSPLVIEKQAQRGQAQGTLTIRNPTNQPTRARMYTEPFTYEPKTGFKVISASDHDLSPYLRFSPREMTIPPGEERRVRFIAQLPPDMENGEYRTVLFTETLIERTNAQGNQVGIQARIGATVYVRVGDINPNLTVKEASYNAQEQEIELLTSNSGKASARVKVDWTLKQQGETIAEGEAPETSVIAQRDRVLSWSLPDKAPDFLESGKYQLDGKLIWGSGENPNTLPFDVQLKVPATEKATTENESK